MLADVPLGAFLSGGIDSTIIVGLMAQRTRLPVKTYSVGFDWKVAAHYDESPHARAVAQRFGTDHHEGSDEPMRLTSGRDSPRSSMSRWRTRHPSPHISFRSLRANP